MNLETSGGKKEHKTPKTDIEDAVVVEEVSGAKKVEETVNLPEESEEKELKVIESLNTPEEVEEAFLVAKEKFKKLANEVEGNNVDFGRSVIHLFEGVNHSYDENVIKNLKIQYLKRLYKCIDELTVTVTGEKKAEVTPLNNVEKNKELDQRFEEYRIKFESFPDGVSFEAPMAVQLASNLIEKYQKIKNQTLNDDLILEKEKLIYNLGLRISELQVALSPKQESLVKPEEKQNEDSSEYKEKRKEFLVAKKEYQEKQNEYEEKLDTFYKSYDSKFFNKAARFFGFQPDLPPELIDLDIECRNLRKTYAKSLNFALKERGKQTYTKTETVDGKENTIEIKNKERNIESSDSAKIAFSNKFILRPNKEFLDKQEVHLLNEKQRQQRNRILEKLSKNKQAIRIGTIILAGVAGTITGGLSAGLSLATFQGVKMVGSIFASTATGLGVKNLLQKGVDKAYANAEDLKKNFSVDDLDNFEKELLLAEKTKRGAERTQMVASAGAAFVAGGVASYALHNTDFSQLFSGKGANSVAVESADSGSRFAGSGPKIDMSGEKDAFLSDDGVVSAPTASSAGLSTESVTETPEIYSVERGDTLWQIMEKRYASELDGLSTVEKNRVLDTLFDKVRDDAGLLKSLELKSHDNIDLIYTDEKINLTALGKELERMADIERGEGVLPPYVKQSSLPVQDGGGVVQQIPIKSQEVPDSVVKTESPLPKVVISEPAPISPDIPPLPKGFYPDNYFKTPSYMEDVKRVFGGEQHFNRVLGREILDVEKRAYDWLTPRERFTSPYEFFKVMKIEDIEKLSQDPNVRIHVQQYGMKYEAFLAWVDKIREMKASGLPSTPGTYLSDLFSRYMVEKFSGRIK